MTRTLLCPLPWQLLHTPCACLILISCARHHLGYLRHVLDKRQRPRPISLSLSSFFLSFNKGSLSRKLLARRDLSSNKPFSTNTRHFEFVLSACCWLPLVDSHPSGTTSPNKLILLKAVSLMVLGFFFMVRGKKLIDHFRWQSREVLSSPHSF